MANQYIRDLSKNVKRGLKYKVEKGISPKLAPIGYLNTKTEARGENYIIKDPDRFQILRKAWDVNAGVKVHHLGVCGSGPLIWAAELRTPAQ